MASPFLNEDILMEIFSRVPAKSVGKFRCLSKTWRTHLSTSRFINLHLTTRKAKQRNLFLIKHNKSFYIVTVPIEDNSVSSKIELPTSGDMVVDSCNGLVLFLSQFKNFVLVNPITLQHVNIPFAPFNSNTILLSYTCGFGYDSYSDDYKIVSLHEVNHDTITQVYSVKSKVWKMVNSSPGANYIGFFTDGASYAGVFTNGAIHWAAYHPSRIVAFSLADEVFYDIPSPKSARDWKLPFDRVFVLEGCLCVIDRSCGLKKDLWIMKEYGVEASWTKFAVGRCIIRKPLYFTRYEEIASITDGKFVVYNLVNGEAKDISVDGVTGSCAGFTFFDSLVSLPSD